MINNLSRYIMILLFLGMLLPSNAFEEGIAAMEEVRNEFKVNEEQPYSTKAVNLFGRGSIDLMEASFILGYSVTENLYIVKNLPYAVKMIIFFLFFIGPSVALSILYYPLVKLKILKEPGVY